MKVFVLPPSEDWIVDRMVKEFNQGNADLVTSNPYEADIVWLLADWCWRQVPHAVLTDRKVVTTVHHIVPEKFGPSERYDFELRDSITDAYHVFNQHTFDFISSLTQKPIHLVPYWANQHIWRPTGTREDIRKKHGLPEKAFLIGSFQRDTEGHDLKSPKLEKGPDLLADAIIKYRDSDIKLFPPDIRPEFGVVLAGWRRQYIMARLDQAGIKYFYFERPSQEVINELYQVINLYPITARHEGGPQALIECGLLEVPVTSRPVGIAEQVLPAYAIHDDVTQARCAIPEVEAWKIPNGFAGYRKLFESL